jgi:WD40 repeat protein
LSLSADGRWLATGKAGDGLFLWDLDADPPESRTLIGSSDSWGGLRFSPNGKLLAAAIENQGKIRRWNVASGEPLTPDLVHAGVDRLEFSPDGETIAAIGGQDRCRRWKTETAEPLPSGDLCLSNQIVTDVRFSPDGRSLLATAQLTTPASDDNASMTLGNVHLATLGEQQRRCRTLVHPKPVTSVEFSPNSRLVATGCEDGMVRVWDAGTDRAYCLPLEHRSKVIAVKFTPDSHRVVVACEDGQLRTWDLSKVRSTVRRFAVETRNACSSFSPNDRYLAVGSEDGFVRIWDMNTGRPATSPLLHRGPVEKAVFLTDGKRLVTGDQQGNIKVWKTGDWQCERDWRPDEQPVRQVVECKSGLVTGGDSRIARLWNISTGEKTREIPFAYPIRFIARDPAGEWLAIAGFEDRVAAWNINAGVEPNLLSVDGSVRGLHFSPTGDFLLIAQANGRVLRWKVKERQFVEPILVNDPITVLAVGNIQSELLATGSVSGSARLWNWRTGEQAGFELLHRETVTALQVSPQGQVVATAAVGNAVGLWHRPTQVQLGRWIRSPWGVESLEFSPGGHHVAIARYGEAQVVDLQRLETRPKDDLALWAEVATAMRLDEDGIAHHMSVSQWRERRQVWLEALSPQPAGQ